MILSDDVSIRKKCLRRTATRARGISCPYVIWPSLQSGAG
jgi:hypothetical protein